MLQIFVFNRIIYKKSDLFEKLKGMLLKKKKGSHHYWWWLDHLCGLKYFAKSFHFQKLNEITCVAYSHSKAYISPSAFTNCQIAGTIILMISFTV
jgi:hypothetical protein